VDTTRVQKPPYQRGRHFRQGGRMMRGQGGRGGISRLPGGSNQFQSLGKLNKLQRYYKTIISININLFTSKKIQ